MFPHYDRETEGRCPFQVCGVKVWNGIPLVVPKKNSSAKKCDDRIHSLHSTFQIQILVLSSSMAIFVTQMKMADHIRTCRE